MDKKPAMIMMYRYLMCLSIYSPFDFEYDVVSTMDLFKLNMYQRLRDFQVPNTILDEIFSDQKNLAILENSWIELHQEGLTEDEIAAEVSQVFFEQLDPLMDQFTEENE